ncbi:hypothetical protein FKP32DRAFT_1037305 [Trametes sanguinea]|nr:hypothetical protein FKP32DRAFT_1037305 [Trametes sanguinea]
MEPRRTRRRSKATDKRPWRPLGDKRRQAEVCEGQPERSQRVRAGSQWRRRDSRGRRSPRALPSNGTRHSAVASSMLPRSFAPFSPFSSTSTPLVRLDFDNIRVPHASKLPSFRISTPRRPLPFLVIAQPPASPRTSLLAQPTIVFIPSAFFHPAGLFAPQRRRSRHQHPLMPIVYTSASVEPCRRPCLASDLYPLVVT